MVKIPFLQQIITIMVRIDTLRSEAIDCLTENILPFWLNNMRDHNRGGWYGQMTGHGELVKNAPRSAVLYARLLWTFAAAYRVLGSMESKEHILPSLLQAATTTVATAIRNKFFFILSLFFTTNCISLVLTTNYANYTNCSKASFLLRRRPQPPSRRC